MLVSWHANNENWNYNKKVDLEWEKVQEIKSLWVVFSALSIVFAQENYTDCQYSVGQKYFTEQGEREKEAKQEWAKPWEKN